ncbi:hypothetical protein niasHT_007614 [Heterodera trifolii]|uniref:Uncharacterized protein n=1 Tax=Heterodera trifolii TaxID=157864 RepID=A0ABD2LPQ3_9BILA
MSTDFPAESKKLLHNFKSGTFVTRGRGDSVIASAQHSLWHYFSANGVTKADQMATFRAGLSTVYLFSTGRAENKAIWRRVNWPLELLIGKKRPLAECGRGEGGKGSLMDINGLKGRFARGGGQKRI